SISKLAEVATETPPGAPADVDYDISVVHDIHLLTRALRIQHRRKHRSSNTDFKIFEPRSACHSYTRLIAPNIVVKMATDGQAVPSEFLALQRVRESTTIPVPRVYHVSLMGPHTRIIMDHISGESLFEIWHRMSKNSKTRVAKTLHNYVLQLRTLRHDVPAPPSPLDGVLALRGRRRRARPVFVLPRPVRLLQ
ncbi:hypothetical protein DXG01_012039, partial [Tephrocybe rancida]